MYIAAGMTPHQGHYSGGKQYLNTQGYFKTVKLYTDVLFSSSVHVIQPDNNLCVCNACKMHCMRGRNVGTLQFVSYVSLHIPFGTVTLTVA